MSKKAQKVADVVTKPSADDGSELEDDEETLEEDSNNSKDEEEEEDRVKPIELISKLDLEANKERANQLAARRALPKIPGKHPTIQQAQEWLDLLSPDAASRISIYIYRLYPIIVRQQTNADNVSNIDVLTKTILDDNNTTLDAHIRNTHGGGSYKILINDSDNRKFNLMDVRVTYSWTEIPPVLDYKELDQTEKKNRAYVTWLKNKGILTSEGEIMATVGERRETGGGNDKEVYGLIRDLIKDRNTGSKGLDETAITHAMSIIAKGGEVSTQMLLERLKGESPEKMLAMIKMMSDMSKPSDNSGTTVTAMVSMMQQSNQMFMQMMQQQAESNNKMFQMQMEMFKAMQPAPKAKGDDDDDEDSPKKQSPMSQLKEIIEIAGMIKGGKVSEPDTTDKILSAVERIGVPVANNVINFLAMNNARQARGQQPVDPRNMDPMQLQRLQQGQVAQEPQQVPVVNNSYANRGRVEGPIEAEPVYEDNEEMNAEKMQEMHIIGAINAYGQTFVNAIKNNTDGIEFGINVINMAGYDNYLPFKLAGEEKVLAIMKANKAFWNQVAMVAKPEEIKQFVHEFVNCEALDADEGDVEEDEEEAIAVPKVAANGSGDKGKRVGRQS